MAWASGAAVFIGAWLVFSAIGLSYPPAPRWNDAICGAFVGAVAWRHTFRPSAWTQWTICLTGVWLLLAPLVFWAPAAVFATDQLAGVALILLSTITAEDIAAPSEIPPGWSYNPSAWDNRVPVVILALVGFFVARVMSAYQLKDIATVWDPFFGSGTETVLTSEVARAFPVSDAGLGAVAYLLEALSGVIGDARRWRTMPWMVLLFFVLVVPAGVVSIVLVMLQPVAVGAWCTLCLLTATVTLLSIPPAVDEVFASIQYLAEVRRKKLSVWKAFWGGAAGPVGHGRLGRADGPGGVLSGVRLTWNLGAGALLGIVVIVLPPRLGLSGPAANSDYVAGALVTTFAILATAEPTRGVRLLNVPAGLWIAVSPFIFGVDQAVARWGHVFLGLLVVPLSLPRGPIRERFGAWNSHIF